MLVFFARNGWGRLVNISENGIAFEFSGLSETGQVTSFELVDLTQNSIQVDGSIVWTRELDKIAGMQFVDLNAENKQQIRQWLSAGRFTQTRVHDETHRHASQVKPPDTIKPPDEIKPLEEVKPLDEIEPPEPPPRQRAAPIRSKEPRHPRNRQPEVRVPQDLVSLVPEPRPETLAKQDPNLEVWDDYFNRAHVGLDKRPIAWLRIVAVVFGLAAFSALCLTAAIWMARYRQSRAEQAQDPRTAPHTRPSANIVAGPFEVEVVDAKNKRWVLTFSGSSDKPPVPSVPRVASGASALPAATPRQSRTVAKNAPDPPARISAPPGKIEPARLISSVPPAYPAAARSQKIAGDVVIDALIDAAGKVTDMNVVSGPIVLRQPAMESVRMSRYSPARLDGRPLSTHLLVTVRYATQ